MSDNVNHPKHYNSHPSGVECIQIVEHYNFNVGNAIKYLWRAGLKEDADSKKHVEDLQKAAWYINREIQRLGGNVEAEPAEVQLAKAAIEKLRNLPENALLAFASAKREDIEKAITDLLLRGIDVTDGPEAVFVKGTRVVSQYGWPGTIVSTDWRMQTPIEVKWDAEGPDGAEHPAFGRLYSFHDPKELALPANPVPVTLEDVKPSRAVPAYSADSTTGLAGADEVLS